MTNDEDYGIVVDVISSDFAAHIGNRTATARGSDIKGDSFRKISGVLTVERGVPGPEKLGTIADTDTGA